MPWWTKEIWQRLKYTGRKGTSNWCGKKLGTDLPSYLQRDRGPSPMDLSCQGSKLRDDKWLVIRQLGLLMRRVGFLKMETRVGKTSADGEHWPKKSLFNIVDALSSWKPQPGRPRGSQMSTKHGNAHLSPQYLRGWGRSWFSGVGKRGPWDCQEYKATMLPESNFKRCLVTYTLWRGDFRRQSFSGYTKGEGEDRFLSTSTPKEIYEEGFRNHNLNKPAIVKWFCPMRSLLSCKARQTGITMLGWSNSPKR